MAEILGDVGRRRGRTAATRWPAVPLSVGAHVVIAIAVFIIPLGAKLELPEPAPLRSTLIVMSARPIPPAPRHAGAPRPAEAKRDAPLAAAAGVARESAGEPSPGDAAPGSGVGGLGILPGVPDGLGASLDVAPAPPPLPAETIRQGGIHRPGGQIREPRRIVHVAPEYPAIARAAGVQGTVILEAVITPDGAVDNIRVVKSIPLLDGAAVAAVRGWRYTPTRLNGAPVAVLVTITINFALHR